MNVLDPSIEISLGLSPLIMSNFNHGTIIKARKYIWNHPFSFFFKIAYHEGITSVFKESGTASSESLIKWRMTQRNGF